MLIKSYKEHSEIESFLKKIEEDCQPFLKILKENINIKTYSGGNPILYRGIKNRDDDFIKEKVRKDRKSLDSSKHVDIEKLDDMYQDKFGVRPRSQGIFCSFDASQADRYGDLFMIFPIGDFNYLVSESWEDTMDAWLFYLEDAKDNFDDEEMSEFINKYGEIEEGQSIPDKYIKDMVVDKTYFNQNIKHGIENGNEIIIICDEYYAIKDKGQYYQKIKKWLDNKL